MTLSGIIVIAVLVILVGSLLAAFIWSESGEDEISEFKKNKNM